jgi:DNA-binding NarL/FixJ family response regulator
MKKILIADDHPIFRKGLAEILKSKIKGITIIEADHGQEALEKFRTLHPDLIILDVDMPFYNGLEVCKIIKSENPIVPIAILTMFKEEDLMEKAFKNGALGYVLKDNSITEIMDCIESISKNERFIGPSLQEFIPKIQSNHEKKKKLQEVLEVLTPVEYKTLKLVCQNFTSKEIADRLFVSTKTVENYRSRICKKLELDPQNNALLKWVLENKAFFNEVDSE